MLTALGAIGLAVIVLGVGWWFVRRKAAQRNVEDAARVATATLRPVLKHGSAGVYRAIEYRVEVSPQGVASLSFALTAPLVNPLEVDAREGFEQISELTRGLDVRALIAMGANYIDVGATAPHVRIEFPPALTTFDRTDVERILGHLLRLRDLSSD